MPAKLAGLEFRHKLQRLVTFASMKGKHRIVLWLCLKPCAAQAFPDYFFPIQPFIQLLCSWNDSFSWPAEVLARPSGAAKSCQKEARKNTTLLPPSSVAVLKFYTWQTGNPRRLLLGHTVLSKAVNLRTAHGLFAGLRSAKTPAKTTALEVAFFGEQFSESTRAMLAGRLVELWFEIEFS